ncbi:MAG: NADAR family protein [Oscillospiraceae bacterium]
MKYSRDNITRFIQTKEYEGFLLFWGHNQRSNSPDKSCLSQWFDCRFTADGREYNTAEQYMMAHKAMLFGDDEVLDEILRADNPALYKKLGRKIRGFDEEIWKKHRTEIVIEGNMAKFSQNEHLKQFLLESSPKVLVEASPYDSIWGIGIAADMPDAQKPDKWRGSNLLGFCLMEVRDRLMNE